MESSVRASNWIFTNRETTHFVHFNRTTWRRQRLKDKADPAQARTGSRVLLSQRSDVKTYANPFAVVENDA